MWLSFLIQHPTIGHKIHIYTLYMSYVSETYRVVVCLIISFCLQNRGHNVSIDP